MTIDSPTEQFGTFNSQDGVVTLETKKHRSGLFHRIGVVDLMSIQECFHNYKEVNVADKIVMDVGANIGGFSFLAAQKGAKEVHCFEPEPHTYAMLVHNVGHLPNIFTHNKALTSSTEDFINFYVGFGVGAPSRASTEFRKGRKCLQANNKNFKEICETIRPEVIKMDVEGGEYDIILDVPECCKEITLEWHGSTPQRQQKFDKVYPLFLQQGWKIVKEKKKEHFKKYALSKGKIPRWSIDGHYVRD